MKRQFEKPTKRKDYLISMPIDCVNGKMYGYTAIAEWLPQNACLTSTQYVFESGSEYYSVHADGMFASVKKEGFYLKTPVEENEEDRSLPWSLKRKRLVYAGENCPWKELPSFDAFDGDQNDYFGINEEEFYKDLNNNAEDQRIAEEVHDAFKNIRKLTEDILKNMNEEKMYTEEKITEACVNALNIKTIVEAMVDLGYQPEKSSVIESLQALDHLNTFTQEDFSLEFKLIKNAFLWKINPYSIIHTGTNLQFIQQNRLYARINRLIKLSSLAATTAVPVDIVHKECALISVAIVKTHLL